MRILGIETSCDETSAAIIENGAKILSNVVASSQKLHIKTGGIIPEIAAREQIKCIIPAINEALTQAFGKSSFLYPIPYTPARLRLRANSLAGGLNPNIDALAVTIGPGLIGSLLVGVETAKTLAYLWGKPIIPVNHLIAHLYANWLSYPPCATRHAPSFPAITLIASGGHTDLLLVKDHGKLRWLGGTRDDAAGEAFDKIARLLSLGYPGGPAIAAKAAESGIRKMRSEIATPAPRDQESGSKLPRPLLNEDNFDFSFSGLKTAVLREVNKLKQQNQFNDSVIQQLAYEVQESITDVLVEKTIRAAQKYKVKSILLGGGVTANLRLREKFKLSLRHTPYTLHIPPPNLSTDNAAIIASCAYFNHKPKSWSKIQANPGLYF